VLFTPSPSQVFLYHVEMFGATFCQGSVVVQSSVDDGHSWSAPRLSLDAACIMVRNQPIVTTAGRWILPAYIQSIYQSQFWLSDDEGATWRPAAPLFSLPNNLQPAVAELCDGSLLALMRTAEGGPTWQGRSGDGGETWSLCPHPDLPNPNSGIDLLRLAGGELILAYNHSTAERTPLVVRLSLDEGESWLPPKVVEEGDPQLSYPGLTQSADGLIHLVYTHRLENIQHAEFNLAWVLAP
jgi:predicted neuraminidase